MGPSANNEALSNTSGRNYFSEDVNESESPLLRALREHLEKYYPASPQEVPFSSRNLVNPPVRSF